MKQMTLTDLLKTECKNIRCSIDRWEHINIYGCNDPFWSDGCNMNLCRNHIIYAKTKIRELCETEGTDYPEEYYLPTPPEVSNWYMADLKMLPDRTERVLHGGRKAITKKNIYDRTQLELSL